MCVRVYVCVCVCALVHMYVVHIEREREREKRYERKRNSENLWKHSTKSLIDGYVTGEKESERERERVGVLTLIIGVCIKRIVRRQALVNAAV